MIALLKTATLRARRLKAAWPSSRFPQGVVVEAQDHAEPTASTNDLVAVSLAPTLPGWRLALGLADAASFDTAANERMAFFLVDGRRGRRDHRGAGAAGGRACSASNRGSRG